MKKRRLHIRNEFLPQKRNKTKCGLNLRAFTDKYTVVGIDYYVISGLYRSDRYHICEKCAKNEDVVMAVLADL